MRRGTGVRGRRREKLNCECEYCKPCSNRASLIPLLCRCVPPAPFLQRAPTNPISQPRENGEHLCRHRLRSSRTKAETLFLLPHLRRVSSTRRTKARAPGRPGEGSHPSTFAPDTGTKERRRAKGEKRLETDSRRSKKS